MVDIIGTVGVPGNYGGFETLVENLVRYHSEHDLPGEITVYCSSKSYDEKLDTYLSARLKYIPLNANGAQSIFYDMFSLISSVWRRSDIILLLGVSGAMLLPFIRLISTAHIITNIDGIEWRRQKWKGLAKWVLRLSEKIAVRFSHEVVADNEAIAQYVKDVYGVDAHVIAYGGDHALAVEAAPVDELKLPASYAFSVCRIEPENNTHMIVEAFSRQDVLSLVIVGNWDNSEYGRELRIQFSSCSNIFLLDPIYDLGKLVMLRTKASLYVHGHSAGGTNPSLVEAMHFGRPILAFDCSFNRYTTENKALFFGDSDILCHLLETVDEITAKQVGSEMLEISQRRYTWGIIAKQYFDLMSAD